MADAVSKLYAEIGFKVNQDGLKQLQSIVKDVANQMNAINKATKEAAKSFGIFSKEQSKQAIADEKRGREEIKSERERIKNKMVIRNQEFKEQMAIRKAEFTERLKEDRERERLARKEQQRNERTNRERKKALNEALHATGNFVKSIGNYLKVGAVGFGRLLYSGVNESLGRSIATRDFMLATGANLGDIQSVMARFAGVGHTISQEQIMGDLIKLSQGIAGIALGQGDADTYKLLGQAAQRGDIAGMIKGIGRAGNYIDNDMFMKLIGNAGLPSYWLSFFKGSAGGKDITNFIDLDGQNKISEARKNLATLSVSFKNLADWIAATLSPTIIELSNGLQDWVQDLSKSLQGEGGEKLSESLKKLSERIIDFVKRFDVEKVSSYIASFVGAMEFLADKIISIARKFGFETKDEREARLAEQSNAINADFFGGQSGRYNILNAFRPLQRPGEVYKPSRPVPAWMGNIIDNRHQELTISGSDDIIGDEGKAFDAMGAPEGHSIAFVGGRLVLGGNRE